MNKQEEIEKIIEIIKEWDILDEGWDILAKRILNEGYRNVNELKEILKIQLKTIIKDKSKSKDFNEGYMWGKDDIIEIILDHLEGTNG
jgi:hypothetical protein